MHTNMRYNDAADAADSFPCWLNIITAQPSCTSPHTVPYMPALYDLESYNLQKCLLWISRMASQLFSYDRCPILHCIRCVSFGTFQMSVHSLPNFMHALIPLVGNALQYRLSFNARCLALNLRFEKLATGLSFHFFFIFQLLN